MFGKWVTRAASLRALGFDAYADYLRSDLWVDIRSRVLTRGVLCAGACRRPAKCLHHATYGLAVMRGTDLTPLIPLCFGCHKHVEFRKDGARRTDADSMRVLTRLVTRAVRATAKKDPEVRKTLPGFCGACAAKLRRDGGPCRACKRRRSAV